MGLLEYLHPPASEEHDSPVAAAGLTFSVVGGVGPAEESEGLSFDASSCRRLCFKMPVANPPTLLVEDGGLVLAFLAKRNILRGA
jgi:hypothetical protein